MTTSFSSREFLYLFLFIIRVLVYQKFVIIIEIQRLKTGTKITFLSETSILCEFKGMGGAVSKRRKISLDERLNYVKKTPFSLYLKDDTLKEFAMCFPSFMECKENEVLVLGENIYLVAQGELTLATTMPDPNNVIENKGYLCKKYPGDHISLTKEQKNAVEKVRIDILHSHCSFYLMDSLATVESDCCMSFVLVCSCRLIEKNFGT